MPAIVQGKALLRAASKELIPELQFACGAIPLEERLDDAPAWPLG